MTTNVAYEIPAHVVARRVGDDVVILDLEGGTYFGLDPVGARIWELLAEGHALAEILDRMMTEFDVDRERLEDDIQSLVAKLLGERLLTAPRK